jgi:hypothetical protein
VEWNNNNNYSYKQDVHTHKFTQDKNRFKGAEPTMVGPGKYAFKDNFKNSTEKEKGYSVGTGGRSNVVRNAFVPGPGSHEQ